MNTELDKIPTPQPSQSDTENKLLELLESRFGSLTYFETFATTDPRSIKVEIAFVPVGHTELFWYACTYSLDMLEDLPKNPALGEFLLNSVERSISLCPK